MNLEILDLSMLGFYSLMSSNSFESMAMLVATMMPVMTELWYNYSQLFALLYTLMYVGAVVILFVFILSVMNEKEEYEYEYSGLFMLILVLLLDDLDDNESNDNDYNNVYMTDYADWFNNYNESDLSVMGNLLFTEYALLLLMISFILLMSIIGLILIVKKD
ncbi:unnamed protein product (mitochondrion) [Komagataella phaffii CBS 7435]|uniref:NADH-ubiquinone oxidoreductase chain 6 n=1 Tax=Komagataella phaffii (strain ATCC 76273 / CBS 7435 / CECT 11047 / NRRL Y-11430 / Wegner 21-1) TaxID=981350 RepID=F2R0K1_KOMPC|nr:unnamed protein product [Komagataella phaffii CBS 7435]